MLLLLAVMSVLEAAKYARDRMLPSGSRLENGLDRWVQDCNSNEQMTTCGDVTQTKACLCSSALNDGTTALRHQPFTTVAAGHGVGERSRLGQSNAG